jgi:HEAT repeat protein
MPVNRSFERELAALEWISTHSLAIAEVERLRRALGHENNYLVAKAARVVAEHAMVELLPEVRVAFDRFFVDPIKVDPQCWAKNALVKALVRLECRESAVFLKGLHHAQEEPVWGGQSDTAGALRAACARALVGCKELSSFELLDILLIPLVDPDKTVRTAAVRAISEVGGRSAALLLKLRVLVPKGDPEVLGACFTALLGMDGADRRQMIPLVTSFLDEGEEAAAEAAYALAETHDEAALAALIQRRQKATGGWFGSVLDNAIALTRMRDGIAFLLRVIESEPRRAASAIEALSRVYQTSEIRGKVASAVEMAEGECARLAFRQFFPEGAPLAFIQQPGL